MNRLIAIILLFVTANGFAAAESHHTAPAERPPATRYDGNVPIDLTNGRLGNSGTVGTANREYETAHAGELVVPGLLAAPYPYNAKDAFVNAINDRLRFFVEAIANLEDKSNINNKPEVTQFSEKALPDLKNRLEQAKTALKTAKGAGEKEWRNAEDGARAAFITLKTTYESFVKTSAL